MLMTQQRHIEQRGRSQLHGGGGHPQSPEQDWKGGSIWLSLQSGAHPLSGGHEGPGREYRNSTWNGAWYTVSAQLVFAMTMVMMMLLFTELYILCCWRVGVRDGKGVGRQVGATSQRTQPACQLRHC